MPPKKVPKSAYVITESGNRISRKAALSGLQNIVLGGKTVIDHGTKIRGDLQRPGSTVPIIAIGRYCYISTQVTVEPPCKDEAKENYYPVRIGDFVYIGDNTVTQAVQIGSHVEIGENCDIGPFCIIKDCVVIDPGSKIPPRTVCAPFTRWAGVPAVEVEVLGESTAEVAQFKNRKRYLGIE
ncbi:Dynactin subunit 5 [Yarrowia sp. C11]|nr:Dynactin subunit 5 [Yarrowia sp. C11]